MTTQQTLPPEIILHSKCPACSHVGLRLEDEQTRRCQCERCGWRSTVAEDGTAQDWLPAWRKG